MQLAFQIAIASLMLLIAFEDFKYRAVHWVIFPVIFLLLLGNNWLHPPGYNWIQHMLLNLAFVALQLAVITVFISAKNQKWVNVLQSGFGFGDLLFLFVITLAFNFEGFLFFTIAGLFATVLMTILFQRLKGEQWKQIPLAGCLAVFFVVDQFLTPFFS